MSATSATLSTVFLNVFDVSSFLKILISVYIFVIFSKELNFDCIEPIFYLFQYILLLALFPSFASF